MKRVIVAIAIVLSLAASLWADQVILNYTEPGAKISGVFGSNELRNFGGNAPSAYLGLWPGTIWGPDPDNGYNEWGDVYIPLYYVPLPDCVIGKTITSATFHAHETYYDVSIDNIALRRLDHPGAWDVGDGTWAKRWGAEPANYSNGVNTWYIHYDCVTDVGTNWAGNPGHDVNAEIYSAVKEEIDWSAVPAGENGTWDVTLLVQKWASGEWANKGFTLWGEYGIWVSGYPGYRSRLNSPELTIDFSTPIPEPATIVLFGTGVWTAIGVLRRRRMR